MMVMMMRTKRMMRTMMMMQFVKNVLGWKVAAASRWPITHLAESWQRTNIYTSMHCLQWYSVVQATYKYLHKYALLTNIYTIMHCLQWCRMRSVGKSWPKACTAPLGLDTEESHSHKPHNCPAIMMIINIIIDHDNKLQAGGPAVVL